MDFSVTVWMVERENQVTFNLIFKQVSVDTHINLGNELDRQPSRQIRRHKDKTRAGTMEERRKKNECECRGPTAYALCVCPPSVSCGHQRPKWLCNRCPPPVTPALCRAKAPGASTIQSSPPKPRKHWGRSRLYRLHQPPSSLIPSLLSSERTKDARFSLIRSAWSDTELQYPTQSYIVGTELHSLTMHPGTELGRTYTQLHIYRLRTSSKSEKSIDKLL